MYSVFLFHVVSTVTVRIFCSRCDASLVYWPFAHLHLKAFYYLCMVTVIFHKGKGGQKHTTKKVIMFPNHWTLLTLIKMMIYSCCISFLIQFKVESLFLRGCVKRISFVLLTSEMRRLY